MRTSRVVVITSYVAAGLFAVAGVLAGVVLNVWLGIAAPGRSTEPMVRTVGTIVSVGPSEVANQEDIDDALRAAEAEGVPRAEAYVPEPYFGVCTVTYSFPVEGQTRTMVDKDPRASDWCELSPGDVTDVAYPVGRPDAVADDYDKRWDESASDARRIVLGLLVAAGIALTIAVGTQVGARRSARTVERAPSA